jgi:hypothetical protein
MTSPIVAFRNAMIVEKTILSLSEGYTQEQYKHEHSKQIAIQEFKELRQERSRRLSEVDWVFSADYQIPDEQRGVWIAYRQGLRDLPSMTEDPTNPVWPTKPSTPDGTSLNIDLKGMKSQITLLQNVVFSLTKRIEALENA